MFRAKLLIGACLAVFALGALTDDALAEWRVGGSALVGQEELTAGAEVLSPAELKILTAGITVKCIGSAIRIAGGTISSPNQLLFASVTFEECEGSGACTEIGNESKISTTRIHGLALLGGSQSTFILLAPETKTALATISFVQTGCALFPSEPVSGSVELLIQQGATELLTHRVSVFSLTKSLKVGTSEADFAGFLFDLPLKSDRQWGFL